MHWFVFFLGACLTVAGGFSLVWSIDLIGVERGTVLAVAGTIALTGGVLTLALGCVLMSLRQISGKLRRRADPQRETASAKNYPRPLGEKASAWPETAAAAIGAAGVGAHSHAAQGEATAAAPDVPEPAYIYPDPPPPAAPAPYAPAEYSVPAALPAFVWPRAEYAPAPPAAGEPALSSPEAHAPRYDYATAYAGPEAVLGAQTHYDPPPSTQEAALPHAPEPTIVGRYNAGGAAYVMFSDGSIEAETTSGHFRFRSMSELKAFIEGKADHSGEPVGARNPEAAVAG